MGSSDHTSDDVGGDLVNLAYERAKRTLNRKELDELILEHEGDKTCIEDSLYGGPCPSGTCDHPHYDHDSEGRCHAAASETQSPSGWGLCACGRGSGT